MGNIISTLMKRRSFLTNIAAVVSINILPSLGFSNSVTEKFTIPEYKNICEVLNAIFQDHFKKFPADALIPAFRLSIQQTDVLPVGEIELNNAQYYGENKEVIDLEDSHLVIKLREYHENKRSN